LRARRERPTRRRAAQRTEKFPPPCMSRKQHTER
jgi:hypothetical protein